MTSAKSIFELAHTKESVLAIHFRQALNPEVTESNSQLIAISVQGYIWSRDLDMSFVLWYCMCHFSPKQGFP
jgi:hypothetical protein